MLLTYSGVQDKYRGTLYNIVHHAVSPKIKFPPFDIHFRKNPLFHLVEIFMHSPTPTAGTPFIALALYRLLPGGQ